MESLNPFCPSAFPWHADALQPNRLSSGITSWVKSTASPATDEAETHAAANSSRRRQIARMLKIQQAVFMRWSVSSRTPREEVGSGEFVKMRLPEPGSPRTREETPHPIPSLCLCNRPLPIHNPAQAADQHTKLQRAPHASKVHSALPSAHGARKKLPPVRTCAFLRVPNRERSRSSIG